MAATLSYFCELVEGEENKLTTFSAWTTMLGCNENSIIFQQHLCKLGQLEIHKYSVKKRPTGRVFTLQGERHCTYYQQQGGELYR